MSRFDNSPNYGLIFFIALVAAGISVGMTKMLSGNAEPKFAIVDLQRVVMVSKDVNALRTERDNQVKELQSMADKANAEIAKISDEAAKKKASEKYLAEINAKKENYDKVYTTALQASEEKLNNIIKEVADKEDLTVVLNSNSVVHGGIDITDSVIDIVK